MTVHMDKDILNLGMTSGKSDDKPFNMDSSKTTVNIAESSNIKVGHNYMLPGAPVPLPEDMDKYTVVTDPVFVQIPPSDSNNRRVDSSTSREEAKEMETKGVL